MVEEEAMIKLPSDEFIFKVRAMTDEELIAAYKEARTCMDNLEVERMNCWNRMMEIHKLQDDIGGEMQALAVNLHYVRKLKLER
jgi:hypothetical protein